MAKAPDSGGESCGSNPAMTWLKIPSLSSLLPITAANITFAIVMFWELWKKTSSTFKALMGNQWNKIEPPTELSDLNGGHRFPAAHVACLRVILQNWYSASWRDKPLIELPVRAYSVLVRRKGIFRGKKKINFYLRANQICVFRGNLILCPV